MEFDLIHPFTKMAFFPCDKLVTFQVLSCFSVFTFFFMDFLHHGLLNVSWNEYSSFWELKKNTNLFYLLLIMSCERVVDTRYNIFHWNLVLIHLWLAQTQNLLDTKVYFSFYLIFLLRIRPQLQCCLSAKYLCALFHHQVTKLFEASLSLIVLHVTIF